MFPSRTARCVFNDICQQNKWRRILNAKKNLLTYSEKNAWYLSPMLSFNQSEEKRHLSILINYIHMYILQIIYTETCHSPIKMSSAISLLYEILVFFFLDCFLIIRFPTIGWKMVIWYSIIKQTDLFIVYTY